MAFGKDFLLGAATAAHQVEGNNIHSDYWARERMVYTDFLEPSGEAVDHYHRYGEDIRLMADAGLNAYRFSIEWARIEPEEGKFDEAETEHYRDVIRTCRENGLEPVVTLMHFTSPKWLIAKGGWESDQTPAFFARYTRYVMEKLGREINYICTINEANMGIQVAAIAKRYMQRMMAGGKSDKAAASTGQMGLNLEKMLAGRQAAEKECMEIFGVAKTECFTSPRTAHGDEIVMEAHGAARAVIRETAPHIRLGLTLSLHDIQALPGGEENAAREWEEEFTHYLPAIEGDDFLGVQNYTRSRIDASGTLPAPPEAELTQMEYEYYPEALEHVIRRVAESFPGSLIVTENGIATSDDSRRQAFIRQALSGVASCMEDGIPVKGYFYWSLLDNFEWQKGYSMTFGLVAVDRSTQERSPRPSLSLLGSFGNRQYFCNPLNFSYQYQFNQKGEGFSRNREAADPSMILFRGKYYLFPSMTRGFLVSEDMVTWKQCPLEGVPVYDYAPDVRVIGDWMYFCASRRGENCDFYRTRDPEGGVFERIEGTFDFWDPNLFQDEDGRLYFYWGCSNMTPIWGVELNPDTMEMTGEPVALIEDHRTEYGYERMGENHRYDPRESHIVQILKEQMARESGCSPEDITDMAPAIAAAPKQYRPMLLAALSDQPYIEGAWMTKYGGKYYLQYACPGTQFNIYNDGVCVGDSPLGPFRACPGNPFSYSPGGFCPGAGHGSTMEDKAGNWWHTSTMRISVSHEFERRVGIWPAGFDRDGELFCNQRYGDWPRAVTGEMCDPWAEPQWMLLSYGKKTTASSEEKEAGYAVDENIQTWWKAREEDLTPWLQVDLGECCKVHAVQVNFADDAGMVSQLPPNARLHGEAGRGRYIEERGFVTRWLLEGSADGENWITLEDKRNADTDLPHDLVVKSGGIRARYIRLTVTEVPYHGAVCISGLRVFGRGCGEAPGQAADVCVLRRGGMDMEVKWTGDAPGYEVLWGHSPDKLYHSYRVFGRTEVEIRALMSDVERYFVRVDAFNENGITHGKVTSH